MSWLLTAIWWVLERVFFEVVEQEHPWQTEKEVDHVQTMAEGENQGVREVLRGTTAELGEGVWNQ